MLPERYRDGLSFSSPEPWLCEAQGHTVLVGDIQKALGSAENWCVCLILGKKKQG